MGLGAAGIFFWLRSQPSTGAESPAAESTLALETFVVNLNASGQRAYLRVGITLGLSRPLKKKKKLLRLRLCATPFLQCSRTHIQTNCWPPEVSRTSRLKL